MGKAFADRWGVPVRAGNADAVALLDSAIEDLAALAGDPVADADAAAAADDSLVLGHIYRAYLQLYVPRQDRRGGRRQARSARCHLDRRLAA